MAERLVLPRILCCPYHQVHSTICSGMCPYRQENVVNQCPTLASLLAATNQSYAPGETLLNLPCYPFYPLTNCLFNPVELCPCWEISGLNRIPRPESLQPQNVSYQFRHQNARPPVTEGSFAASRSRLVGREQVPSVGLNRRRVFGRTSSSFPPDLGNFLPQTELGETLNQPLASMTSTPNDNQQINLPEDFLLPEPLYDFHSVTTENYDSLLGLARQLAQAKPKGLTRLEINQMQAYLFRPNLKRATGQTNCVICMSDFETRQKIRVMPCKHHFHSKCIDKWLKGSRTCPICRHECKSSSAKKSSKRS